MEKIVIMYDQSKEYAEDKNLLNILTKSLLYRGNEVTLKKLTLNNINNLEDYDEIYILKIDINSENNFNNIKDAVNTYNKPIHYLDGTNYEDYISYSDIENEFYFYLNNVTPFMDLNNLINEINYLKENGIKFFIEVPPIFINEDLKAMGRFSECLRYAQASGGKVVLRFPVINGAETNSRGANGKIISEKMEEGFNNYINYWIYPMALSVNDNDLYSEDLKKLIETTDTLFLNLQDNINIDIDNYSIKSYKNIIQKISIDDYIQNKDSGLYMKNAICIENNDDIEEFKKDVNKVLKQEINCKDTSNINSYIKLNNNEITNNFKGIFLNGQDVSQTRFISEKEYKSAFDVEEKHEEVISVDLEKSNRILELISIVSLVIFVVILIISRKIERKKYFK